MSWYEYPPYVPVAARRAKAQRAMQKLRKKGEKIQPIEIDGRAITHTFWGKAWCSHLEKFSDYANRLPRGRAYVRNGSVCHLEIKTGSVNAIVSGSELYHINITIAKLPDKKWRAIKRACSGKIGSLLELLQGRLASAVMAVVTDTENGLFPSVREIKLDCDCPDWAGLCKHLAAVLYGIGARLDEAPELLFLLRGADHSELIETGIDISLTDDRGKTGRHLDSKNLSEIFGIEMDETVAKGEHGQGSDGKDRRSRRKTIATAGKRTNQSPKKGGKVKIGNRGEKPCPNTGAAVAKLRKMFAMTESAFALLLGVTRQTIRNWEKRRGTLNLRQKNHETLKASAQLNKQQAWRKLGDL
ncbi:MAG: SWIM zinc finger family protein [bacterium]